MCPLSLKTCRPNMNPGPIFCPSAQHQTRLTRFLLAFLGDRGSKRVNGQRDYVADRLSLTQSLATQPQYSDDVGGSSWLLSGLKYSGSGLSFPNALWWALDRNQAVTPGPALGQGLIYSGKQLYTLLLEHVLGLNCIPQKHLQGT